MGRRVKVSRLLSLKCPLDAQMKMADQELNLQEQFLAGDRNLGVLTPFFLGKGLKIGKKNSKSRRKCLDRCSYCTKAKIQFTKLWRSLMTGETNMGILGPKSSILLPKPHTLK